MKRTIGLLAFAVLSHFASAQETPNQSFIKGSFDIAFKTRSDIGEDGKARPGVTDHYKLAINVADAAKLSGDIQYLPPLFSSVLGRETQQSKLDYRIDLEVVNPANPSQSKRVGRLVGTVPVDRKGAYRFNDGSLMVGVDASGKAAGFESKFRGIALGKPPKIGSKLESIRKDAITLTRDIGGKKVSVVVKDYDRMTFQNLVLAAGPVQTYPEVTVDGEMLYDYERSAWYFRNVSLVSTDAMDLGRQTTDKLTGNIRWVESPQRASNGEGEYQFDVRVNEPETKSDAGAVFAKADDESAFFATNDAVPALTGTAKYKDTFSGSGEQTVVRSLATINLTGNKLTKRQVMALTKLIWLASVVPMNTD